VGLGPHSARWKLAATGGEEVCRVPDTSGEIPRENRNLHRPKPKLVSFCRRCTLIREQRRADVAANERTAQRPV